MPKPNGVERINAFANPSADEIANDIFGGPPTDLPSNPIRVEQMPIAEIWPDFAQPRRVIPSDVRRNWNGNPAELTAIFERWQDTAEDQAGQVLRIEQIIFGRDADLPTPPENTDWPIFTEFIAVVSLAASIKRDGLQNPITIAPGNPNTIITGERRWLAYHLLSIVDDEKWNRIPARKSQADVWAQAAENGSRRPLNAVSMARQLALLIMAMYTGDDGVSFTPYRDMVLPGECDRKFYAQARNYQIKRGQAQRILDVTGLSSKGVIHHYRNLLSISDELWDAADKGNYAEFTIREMAKPQSDPTPEKQAENGVRSTAVDLTGENHPDLSQNNPNQPQTPLSPAWEDYDTEADETDDFWDEQMQPTDYDEAATPQHRTRPEPPVIPHDSRWALAINVVRAYINNDPDFADVDVLLEQIALAKSDDLRAWAQTHGTDALMEHLIFLVERVHIICQSLARDIETAIYAEIAPRIRGDYHDE